MSQEALQILKNGGLVVLPTDTLYGVVASALLPQAVERVFFLRKRDTDKPVIILIADEKELEQFSIFPDDATWAFLRSVWPGKVSVILPAASTKWNYLHRGTNTLAFRVPADEALRAFLKQSGPLIAPSANKAGEPPATTIEEATHSFGDQVTLYIDGGKRNGPPSTLVAWTPEGPVVRRPGAEMV